MTNRSSFRLVLMASVMLASLFLSSARAGFIDGVLGSHSDMMEKMFEGLDEDVGNVTAARAFNSQARGGFTGGSISMRSPIQAINLVSFDPPRLSAGCGGLDMYGGSFSFIDLDGLIDLFRKIAANAKGLAFKLAIDYINPALGKAMQDFQAKLQSLNQMMKNTCAVANQVVNFATDPKARTKMIDDAAEGWSAAKGFMTDPMAAMQTTYADPTQQSTEANDANDPDLGNLTWKAIRNTQAGSMLPELLTYSNPDDQTLASNDEILMTLIGTVIMDKQKGASQGGVADKSPKPAFNPPHTLFDLLNYTSLDYKKRPNESHPNPFRPYLCKDGKAPHQCLQVERTTNTANFGLQGYLNKILWGSPLGKDGSPSECSLTGVLTKNSCPLSDARVKEIHVFLETNQTPVLALLKRVQHEPGAVDATLDMLYPLMYLELAEAYGRAINTVSQEIFSRVTTRIPPEIIQNNKDRQKEFAQLQEAKKAYAGQFKEAVAYVDGVVKFQPEVFAQAFK